MLTGKWMLRLTLLLVFVTMAGCANRQPVGNEYCSWAFPFYLTEEDLPDAEHPDRGMTEAHAKDVWRHNERGANLCGWPRIAP